MANQTLTDAYAYIGTTNIEFQRNKDRWQFLLDSYLGGDEYRKGGHLVKYTLETDQEYQARLRSTPLDNHCRSVISVYISFLFRESPDRDFASLENEPALEDFLADADLDGRSFDAFMKETSIWSSVFGHCWVLMTKPSIEAVTLADQLAQGVRPYVNLLTPLVVSDWRWSRLPNGRYELTYFKYIEDVNDSVTTIREWTPDLIRTYKSNTKTRQADLVAEEINELGKIPVVLVYNERSQVRGLGISDITDIADQQRAIYNELSEVEQSVRLEGHPSLVVTPDTQVGAGAGAMIQMPDNLDPGLKPFMLNADATPIDMIYKSIENRVKSIDRMANTGSIRATEVATLSGIAMETEFQLLNAKLSEKADNLQLAEEQLWELYCEYQGYTWDGEIEYAGSFNIRDTGREVQQLVGAKSAATDPAVLAVIDYKLLELLDEEPDEIVAVLETLMPAEPADPAQVAGLIGSDENFTEPESSTPPQTLAQAQAELEGEPMIDGCPLPMVDKATNIANHLICVAQANLGPASVSQPGTYWIQRADRLGITPAESRTQRCSNCAWYMNTTQIQDCWDTNTAAGNIPLATEVNPAWENVPNPAGYCLRWDITCTPTRSCDTWAAGGPITDQGV